MANKNANLTGLDSRQKKIQGSNWKMFCVFPKPKNWSFCQGCQGKCQGFLYKILPTVARQKSIAPSAFHLPRQKSPKCEGYEVKSHGVLTLLNHHTTRSAKKKKNNFINVIGDKFAMNIRWRKLTISFCNKLFSRINYL